MELREYGFYLSNSVEIDDIAKDIKFVFERFIKDEEQLSKKILFYIDGTNAVLYIGYIKGEEDSDYLGEQAFGITFCVYQQDIELIGDFDGDIEAAVKEVILSIKDDFSNSFKFYCGNDAESEIEEIDGRILE